MKQILLLGIAATFSFSTYAQKGQVENAMQEKYMKEHGNDGMAKLQDFMDNMSNATTRPEYKFPLSLTMKVTEYKNGNPKESTDIKYHVNAAEEIFSFIGKENRGGNKDMQVIYDSKNNAMVMIDEAKKSYVAMNINAFMSAEAQARRGNPAASKDDVKCNKTGKSKNVNGYPCVEYVCIDEDKDSKVEVWVTNKIPVNMAKAAKGQPWAMYYTGLDGMSGMMMEGKVYEKGKLNGTMEVTDINEKANHTISLSKYKKMDMFGGR